LAALPSYGSTNRQGKTLKVPREDAGAIGKSLDGRHPYGVCRGGICGCMVGKHRLDEPVKTDGKVQLHRWTIVYEGKENVIANENRKA